MKETSRKMNKDNITYNTRDRKSTRLNSSHALISYAVFCLKKKKQKNKKQIITKEKEKEKVESKHRESTSNDE